MDMEKQLRYREEYKNSAKQQDGGAILLAQSHVETTSLLAAGLHP